MNGHAGTSWSRVVSPVAAALALLGTGGSAHGQVFAELGVGAVYQSDLVQDSIVQSLHAGLAIAPSVVVAVGTPLDGLHGAAVSLGWSRSDLERREGDATTPILPVTVWSVGVQLRRRLHPGVVARLEVGGIKYAPDTDGRASTIFRDDAPFLPAVTLGTRIERRIGGRVALGLDITYGAHQFTTLALRDDGFAGHRTVHRVKVALVLRGGHAQVR